MQKSNYTILTCFLLFANSISYLFSTIVCEIFEIRKKKEFREWLLNGFLGCPCLCIFLWYMKKQTMCYFTYEDCAIKLCGCIVWGVILFSVLKNTIAILPIHQHPPENLTGSDLVAGPWRAPGRAGNSQGHLWLCCRKRQECNIWNCEGCDQEKVKYVYWWGEIETRESSELGNRKKTNKKTPEKWHTGSTMGKVKGFRTQSLRHTLMVACYVKDPF